MCGKLERTRERLPENVYGVNGMLPRRNTPVVWTDRHPSVMLCPTTVATTIVDTVGVVMVVHTRGFGGIQSTSRVGEKTMTKILLSDSSALVSCRMLTPHVELVASDQ